MVQDGRGDKDTNDFLCSPENITEEPQEGMGQPMEKRKKIQNRRRKLRKSSEEQVSKSESGVQMPNLAS